MRLPDSLMRVLLLGLVLSPGMVFMREAAAQTFTNNESNIYIEGIDIAPTNTPRPSRGALKRRPSLSPQPSIATIPSPVVPESKPEPKVFFTLSLAQSDVDFGQIDPTNPVIRTHSISLNTGNARGVSLFAYQNHPLQIPDTKTTIPDTSCDDGRCTQAIASGWENTLTYGVGFRCDNESDASPVCAREFANPQNYRQFADVSHKESGIQVLSTTHGRNPLNARLTYKVNVPGTQPAGRYTNAFVLIASPTF